MVSATKLVVGLAIFLSIAIIVAGVVTFFVLTSIEEEDATITTTISITTDLPPIETTQPETTTTSVLTTSVPDTTTPLIIDEFENITGPGIGSLDQDFGYVNVKTDGQMFWWLFTATNTTDNAYTERPLIIWLQGLFGESSSGHGVFQAVGPYDLNLNDRENTWVQNHNVLFIDAPLGTGFSHLDGEQVEESTVETAENIVILLIQFYNRHPEFESVPLHIFGQFYGANIAAELALQLDTAISDNLITANLQSVALGNGLISPADNLEHWGVYLEDLAYVDGAGREVVDSYAQTAINSLRSGNWEQGGIEWLTTMQMAVREAIGINVFRITDKVVYEPPAPITWADVPIVSNMQNRNEDRDFNAALTLLMNQNVKPALGIPGRVMWGGQQSNAMDRNIGQIFTPSTETVSRILNGTNIQVIIYNGNLDLLSNTPGQLQWVENLNWEGAANFRNTRRTSLWVDAFLEGYRRSYDNLHFYWINAAGLKTPLDNPDALRGMLQLIAT